MFWLYQDFLVNYLLGIEWISPALFQFLLCLQPTQLLTGACDIKVSSTMANLIGQALLQKKRNSFANWSQSSGVKNMDGFADQLLCCKIFIFCWQSNDEFLSRISLISVNEFLQFFLCIILSPIKYYFAQISVDEKLHFTAKNVASIDRVESL